MIVYKGPDDISVFNDFNYMVNWIEAIDIEEGTPEVYTDDGRRILLSVLPSGNIKVEFSEVSESNRMKFRKGLQKYVKKILESGARSRVIKNDEVCLLIASMFAIDKE